MNHGRALATVVVFAALVPSSAAAATITVTTTADPGGAGTVANCPGPSCSLRDAIAYATANAGTVIDAPVGEYKLGGTPLQITAPMTITGHGDSAAGTEIVQQAGGGAGVLEITADAGTVSISGAELTGGNAAGTSGAPAYGGGVYVHPAGDGLTVSLANDRIDHNSATGFAPLLDIGTPGGSAGGGGIAVEDFNTYPVALTLSDCVVSDNVVSGGAGGAAISGSAGGRGGGGYGAGVDFDTSGSVQISGSDLSSNQANGAPGGTGAAGYGPGSGGGADGAGLYDNGGSLTITESTVNDNTATGAAGANAQIGQTDGVGGGVSGAGLSTFGNTVTITRTTVEGNRETNGADGTGGKPADGFFEAGGGADLGGTAVVVEQSTIAGNQVHATNSADSAGGGGIYADSPNSLTIVDSTITANKSLGSSSTGGGLETSSTQTTLAGDTIDANTAANAGAGANLESDGSVVKSAATIIAAPLGGALNCGKYLSSASFTDLTSPGGNLEDDVAGSCGFATSTGDVVGKSAELGALASNGGPTATMLPAPGSPAIGAGGACPDPTKTPTGRLTLDQRGFARPAGGPCDIGAVQIQAPASTRPPGISPAKPTAGQTLTCTAGAWTGDGIVGYSYRWLRDGTAIAGASRSTYPTHAADATHKLSCIQTATSAYGHTSSATSAAVRLAAPTPAISHARESHRRWRERGKPAKHKPPVGTTFTFTLNTGARVTLSFKRRRATVGTLTVAGKAGPNTVSFTGKLARGKRLRPGSYTVAIAAGRSKPALLRFTIVR